MASIWHFKPCVFANRCLVPRLSPTWNVRITMTQRRTGYAWLREARLDGFTNPDTPIEQAT
jgi:hypothetical protein